VPGTWLRMPAVAGYCGLVLACARPQPPEPATAAPALAVAESIYADLRALRDQYAVASALGRQEIPLGRRHDSLRFALDRRFAEIDSAALPAADRRALEIMRRTLGHDLTPVGFGAVLIAAIRERTRVRHHPFAAGDSSWYAWVVPRLLRFGLERPSREVLREFLGR
jgi:hypothetical protein